MKRLSAVLILVLCLSLCACSLDEVTAPPVSVPDVRITAGKIEAGMTVRDVSVEVTIDREPVAIELELTRFTETGYYVMAEDEVVPEDFYGRLDVYYSLPKGVDVDGIEVTMKCDGGEYDGTGSVGDDEKGNVVAWSHAIYGTEPVAEEVPTEVPTEAPTETPTEAPAEAPTEAPTEAPHVHSWVEDESKGGIVGCNFDGYKTYVCSCGETQRETIPAYGHNYEETFNVEPTCTKSGHSNRKCKNCGDMLLNELPATGHSWSAWAYENGRLHKHACEVCGAEEEENHNVPSGTLKCTGCGQDIVN